MATLEQQFEMELMKQCQLAQEACPGYNPTRLIGNIQRFGVLKAVKELVRKGQPSDGFNILADGNKLALTMEAMVIKGKYGELFTDEEVNKCFELLCAYGYFG